MGTETTSPLEDVDLADVDRFAERVPHEDFALLRRVAPVHWQPEPRGRGFWSLTRHADVVAASKDTATFSSELGGTSLEDLTPRQVEARKSMLDTDPPRHTELRALVKDGFTPRAVGVYEDRIRDLMRRIQADAFALGAFDFVREVSVELPMRIFAELLGAPVEDRLLLVDLGNRMLGRTDPDYVETPADRADLAAYADLPFSSPAALEMFAYGQRLAAARRAEPRDDIVTLLVRAELDGRPLTDREYDVYFLLLAVAGNETTRHAMSIGLQALLDHPEEAARLREDPALIPSAVEEILRWSTPVLHFRRTAARDVELHGTTIRAGDKVVLWYISANRDEDVFPDPLRFDVGRRPNRHTTFGLGGPHFCLGAHLSRLELRIWLEELLPHLPRLAPAGPAERLRSNFFNGVKRLPVRVGPS